MEVIRRRASHGGACVGVKDTSQKHISFYQAKKNMCVYMHILLCVGIFWYLKLHKAESICFIHVGVCSLGHS
jgi:hypothetical protein